jgi:hypothetical protein
MALRRVGRTGRRVRKKCAVADHGGSAERRGAECRRGPDTAGIPSDPAGIPKTAWRGDTGRPGGPHGAEHREWRGTPGMARGTGSGAEDRRGVRTGHAQSRPGVAGQRRAVTIGALCVCLDA